MIAEVQAFLAAERAVLVPDTSVRIEPLSYGRDLYCVSDISPLMTEVDPTSTEAIAQAILRRWDTPRGENTDDLFGGDSLKSRINRGATPVLVAAWEGQLGQEAEKDDRVQSCEVKIRLESLGTYRVQARVVPEDPRETFDLVAKLADTGFVIEGLTR